MAEKTRTRVAVNGLIGKRVCDAGAAQEDMELVGVADVSADWWLRLATRRGYRLFDAAPDRASRLARRERDGRAPIERTNAALGIGGLA